MDALDNVDYEGGFTIVRTLKQMLRANRAVGLPEVMLYPDTIDEFKTEYPALFAQCYGGLGARALISTF